MGIFTKLAQQIFASVDETGNPRTISEQEVGVWGTEVEASLNNLGQLLSASVVRGTKAELDAVVSDYEDGDIGLVVLDPNTSLQGVYEKAAGIWVKRSGLPDAASAQAAQAAAEDAADDAQGSADAAAISEYNAAQSAADAAASAIGASPPVALTGLVGSRGMMPTGFQAFTQMNSRTRHFARDNINRVQFLFGNWYFSTGESPGLGNMTLTAAIEYPKGRIIPLQWSTNPSVVIGPGDNAPLTDPAFVSIPDGAEFWVRTFMTLAEGCTVCEVKDSVGGDLAEYGSGELTDKSASGTITNSASQYYCYGPLAIVGETHKPSILILGDSRNHAAPSAVHLDAQSNRGNIAHAIGGQFGYINCAKGGSTMAQLIASHTRIVALKTYCTDVVIQHGINDISAGASGATALSSVDSIIGYFSDKNVWTATIEPYTPVSSDGWTTGGGQTVDASNPQRVIYNDGLRAIRSGVKGNFEFADDVESIRDSGIWKVADSGVAITSDGVHLNDNGHQLADNHGSIDPRRIYRYPEPVARWSTRDQWEKGESALSWLSPNAINRSRLFASKSADQTGIAAASSVTISWQNIDMRGGYFDTTNNRWYPPKGKYRVHSQIMVTAGIEDNQIAIMRARQPSGIVIQTGMRTKNTSAFSISVDKVLEFNGVGDYIVVDLNITGTGDKTVSGNAAHTYLEVYAV
ncbi:SGNH/GDSL hydrolase family protein [Neorhizobium sp. Rsf11]|uniref:SGNH/GDSL hydrolase family protein n=1 Tax=Neorhizobium phenanthreniclasticum TaxID=3157917 RepID=A0ABV0LW40_9HYPH